ncbi:MAG: hypothetical protein BJ554DRAFT_3131 [Olpidium bornovanus]|uniref:Uncharacterized protein n=1 Tax=Olpidium bornovanus TaxID=278681 RepID=A0A8H8A0U4_9FUNG|nr:MAG: hypothetical protein BJ554DRAFT_3131 [Olpidium bornovanus]
MSSHNQRRASVQQGAENVVFLFCGRLPYCVERQREDDTEGRGRFVILRRLVPTRSWRGVLTAPPAIHTDERSNLLARFQLPQTADPRRVPRKGPGVPGC